MNFLSFLFKGSLLLRIAIAIVLALLIHFALPDFSAKLGILGDIFVSLLRAIAPVIIFILIISAIGSAPTSSNKNILHIVAIYIISIFIAALVGVLVNLVYPVTIVLEGVKEAAEAASAPGSALDIVKTQLLKALENPFSALVHGNFISLLFWAILIGIAVRSSSDTFKTIVSDFSGAILKVVTWIVQLAPFGVFGILSQTLVGEDLKAFLGYLNLVGVLLVGFAIAYLIVVPFIGFILIKRNPYPLLFKCFTLSGITAFFGRSSVANIPMNINAAQAFGLKKEIYSFTIPFGANINLTGSSITIATLAIVAAYSIGLELTFGQALLVALVSAVAAAGASGVPGGALIIVPVATSILNIPDHIAAQMVAVGFLIAVIQDSIETMINSSSDLFYTTCYCESKGLIDETEQTIKIK